MDGLSGAASGMAVVSLALQLGASIKHLYDFWGSVKDAPDEFHAITTDLSLLASVLAEMAFEEQCFEPDHTLPTVLEACCDKVNKLAYITNEMVPGFASRSLRIRKWTAFRAVLKGERIQRFQQVLEGLKITLMLAQQNYHCRLNRTRYRSQQQDLALITKHLSSLDLKQVLATTDIVSNSSLLSNYHANAIHDKASPIYRTTYNPVRRGSFEPGSNAAVQDIASNLSKNEITSFSPLASLEGDRPALSCCSKISHQSGQQTLTNDTLSRQSSVIRNLFGTIAISTQTRFLRLKSIDDEALEDEGYQYERESFARILPAQWLLRLGFKYAYSFSTHDSSTRGWQFCMKPINLVPDDASLFEFCRQGNIEKVRELISRDLASVRDVDSRGRTALHFAAQNHNAKLCKFLIEAGADKNARSFGPGLLRSPLSGIYQRSITKDGLVNAIDTCRIFEASFDFWDQNGEGWNVLKWVPLSNCDQSTADVEATLTFLLWLIRSSSRDIQANYDTEGIFELILRAHPGIADAIDVLLGLGPPKAIDKLQRTSASFASRDTMETFAEEGITLLCYLIILQKWDHVQILLALGANPHHTRFNSHFSPVAESPLSLAMYSSWAFWVFRNALVGTSPDVKDIACQELKQECPLLDAGWQMETLIALLELNFEPDVEPSRPHLNYHYCDCCSSCIVHVEVQPYWQCILESIRNRTYPGMVGFDAQIEQSLSSQSHLTTSNKDFLINIKEGSQFLHDYPSPEGRIVQPDKESFLGENDTPSVIPDRNEVWCVWCWYYYKDTGHRRSPNTVDTQISDEDDSSEDDFSPFLFNSL